MNEGKAIQLREPKGMEVKEPKGMEVREPGTIQLREGDKRWYAGQLNKEKAIREVTANAYKDIGIEAERMMNELSDREGVDMRQYDINWKTGEAKPRRFTPKQQTSEDVKTKE